MNDNTNFQEAQERPSGFAKLIFPNEEVAEAMFKEKNNRKMPVLIGNTTTESGKRYYKLFRYLPQLKISLG